MRLITFLTYFEKYGFLLNEAHKNKYIEEYSCDILYEDEIKGWHTCCITTVNVLKRILTYNISIYYSRGTILNPNCKTITFNLTPTLKVNLYECFTNIYKQTSLSMTIDPKQDSSNNLFAMFSILKSYSFVEINFSFDCHSAVIVYNQENHKSYWINSYGDKTKVVIYEYEPIALFRILYNIVTYKEISLYNNLTHADIEITETFEEKDLWIGLEFFELMEPTLQNINHILKDRNTPNFLRKSNESLEWLSEHL